MAGAGWGSSMARSRLQQCGAVLGRREMLGTWYGKGTRIRSGSYSTDWLDMQWVTAPVSGVRYCRDGIVTSGSHSWKIRKVRNLSKIVIFRGWVIINFKKFLMLSMDVESESSGHVSKLLGIFVTKC